MQRTIPIVFAMLTGTVLLWRCGGEAGDECSPECGPGLICYYGTCILDPDAGGEAESGAETDVPADVPVEAEAESGADGDGDADAVPDGEMDVVPDGVVDVVPDGEVPVDIVPDGVVDVIPDGEVPVDIVDVEAVDVRPDTESAVDVADVRPDVDIVIDGEIVDVRPDTDVVDVTIDAVVRCGPWPGGSCLDGQVCDIRSCLDGASGVCVPRPVVCMPLWAPVCGCDGVTYGNDCERLAAGAALDHDGECAAVSAPICVGTADGGAAWLDGDGTLICRAACMTCTASCLYEGSFSEGWYAVCSGSSGDGGCGLVPSLIAWTDCSP